jgi:hypothetical protein
MRKSYDVFNKRLDVFFFVLIYDIVKVVFKFIKINIIFELKSF